MTINAEDFGVVGDGERHNTLELIALRDHIRDGPDRVWQVEFEPGHYAYEDERWLLFGARTVVLEFNNSTVECKARPLLPLATNSISFDNEFPAKHAFNKAAGLLIESVEVNATEAKLAQPAPGHFLPGDAVLAAGPHSAVQLGWHQGLGLAAELPLLRVEDGRPNAGRADGALRRPVPLQLRRGVAGLPARPTYPTGPRACSAAGSTTAGASTAR